MSLRPCWVSCLLTMAMLHRAIAVPVIFFCMHAYCVSECACLCVCVRARVREFVFAVKVYHVRARVIAVKFCESLHPRAMWNSCWFPSAWVHDQVHHYPNALNRNCRNQTTTVKNYVKHTCSKLISTLHSPFSFIPFSPSRMCRFHTPWRAGGRSLCLHQRAPSTRIHTAFSKTCLLWCDPTTSKLLHQSSTALGGKRPRATCG